MTQEIFEIFSTAQRKTVILIILKLIKSHFVGPGMIISCSLLTEKSDQFLSYTSDWVWKSRMRMRGIFLDILLFTYMS